MPELKCRDSYQLMEYTCETCGKVELIWNGRDNVSPFMVGCSSCPGTMAHTNWNKDRCVPDYKPPTGSRYFAELTRDRAAEIAKKRVDSFVGTEFELKPGTPEYDEMIEDLTVNFLSDCCSMDLITA